MITVNSSKLLATAFFLIFTGYYFLLSLIFLLGFSSESRLFTTPIRAVVLMLLIMAFFLRKKNKFNTGVFSFIVFSLLYFLRILLEYLQSHDDYHQSLSNFFIFFTTFVFLPFLLVSRVKLNEHDYFICFKSVLYGGILFALVSLLTYKSFLTIGIRSVMIYEGKEDIISPLSLSYTSSLVIGIVGAMLMTLKLSNKWKLVLYLALILNLIPFLLGASRGSIFAIFVPFLIYFYFAKGLKNKIRNILVLGTMTIFAFFGGLVFQSAVFERFLTIRKDIDEGSTSAIRIEMWKSGWLQFLENPIFGNGMDLLEFGYYPHNFFIEVLITTGLLGLSVFVVFLVVTFRKSVQIIKGYPHLFFIVIIFYQSFVKAMFSSSIYEATWFAVGSALVLGFSTNPQPKLI